MSIHDNRATPSVAQPALLIALNLLYVGFGAVLGLIQGGLPPILMSEGSNVGQAGWAFAFYMPFGLAFLWASMLERRPLPFWGMSKNWVVLMQLATISCTIGLALIGAGSVPVLIILGFGAAFAMATMDLALDGLAVESIAPEFRSWAAGSKLAALSLGAMLGGGLLVAKFEDWGRESSFLLLAVFLTLLLVPFLLLRLPQKPTYRLQNPASIVRLLADPAARRRLTALILVCGIIFPATGLNRLMLVSLEIPLKQIGWIVGTLGPVGMIIASAIAVTVINTWGSRPALMGFCGLGLLSICLMLVGVVTGWTPAALIGAVIIGGSVGGIFVVYAARILGWAEGAQPITDYAAYYGISRFVAALAMMLSAQLVQHIQWTGYFSGIAILFAGLMLYFYKENEQ